MSFEPCHLPERAVLSAEGAEAGPFLHGLLTNDILGMGAIAYAALLTPQGKIFADLFVAKEEGRYLIDCPAAKADELLNKLSLYRLRAKVGLALEERLIVAVSPHGGAADPRLPALGYRTIGEGAAPGPTMSYHINRIRHGVADSGADLDGMDLFPHEANLDQLHGVSFTKGCYVGQEIVARMQHRGTARSRVLPVRVEGGAPAKGVELKAATKTVGTLMSSSGPDALALVRLDRLHDAYAQDETVMAEGRVVTVRKPDWASFHVPVPRTA